MATLRIELPPEDVRKEWDAIASNYSRYARIPGYRAGKAPRQVIEKKFRKEIQDELTKALVSKSYHEAIAEKQLRVVTLADLGDVEFGEDRSMRFRATVVTAPEFELPDFAGALDDLMFEGRGVFLLGAAFVLLPVIAVVVLILVLGQSRVAFAMSRDNLLPRWFSRVHTRFRTPHRITIITGVVAGLLAFWLPLTALAELVNIGTLAAFILVSIGIIVLRRSRPDLPRAFKVPGYPVVPILSAIACFLLMGFLTYGTWVRFFVWMAIGIVFYFGYSRSHSRLANEESSAGTNQNA